MGKDVGWVLLQQPPANRNGVIVAARSYKDASLYAADDERRWIEQISLIDFRQSIPLSAADHAKVLGEPLMGGGIVGIECKGLPEFGLAASKIPIVFHLVAAENGVRMSQTGIQTKSLAGCGARFREVLGGIPTEERKDRINVSEG